MTLPTEVLCDSVLVILIKCSDESYITSITEQSTFGGIYDVTPAQFGKSIYEEMQLRSSK